MSVYEYEVAKANGDALSLGDYKGKVLLVVNTASKCGFTPQYQGLQELHEKYESKGLVILGFPCNQFGKQEPGDAEEIASFCSLNYGVSFSVMAKVEVNGKGASPFWNHLKDSSPGLLGTKAIKWNFTKFLVNKKGEVVGRFAPKDKPEDLVSAIEELLT